MGLTPVLHPGQHIGLGLRIPGIYLHEVLLIPVVGGVVVHGDLFPDPVGQETHCVFVEGHNILHRHSACRLVIAPFPIVHFLICGSVIHFPVGKCPGTVVDGKLFCKKALHQMNGYFRVPGHHSGRTQESLL